MVNNKQTISVIIPAHNEEQNIKACIQSLLAQEVKVDEIIVVCNNCSDSTAQIARSFKNIKVIETEEKGLINARNVGFNYSKCDVLARINADVSCTPDWIRRVLENFKDEDLSALAGVAKTNTTPFLNTFYSTFWSKIYLLFVETYFGVPILWGANMVIRNTTWQKIKSSVCLNDFDVHEDQDLSIHIAEINGKVKKDTKLIVITNERSYFKWKKFYYYNKLRIVTKKTHRDILKSTHSRFNFPSRFIKGIIFIVPGLVFSFSSAFLGTIQYTKHCLFYKHR